MKIQDGVSVQNIGFAKCRQIGAEVMGLLLDRKGNEVQIAEGVVTAAARNGSSAGAEVVGLLLDRKENNVHN